MMHTLAIGLLGGLAGAVVTDLHAYSAAPDGAPFAWRKAVARWIAGALTGAMTAAGLGFVA